MWLLEDDKTKHFTIGAALTYIIYVVLLLTGMLNPWICVVFSFIISALISCLKEIVWDKIMGKGVPNWKDFYAGLLGDMVCTLGIVILLLL